MDNITKVKGYLADLNYSIVREEDNILVIDKEEEGIKNMFIVIEDPILIVEQFLYDVKKDDMEMYKALLQKNQDIIHGAFALNETGEKVIFRDTLQVENLDENELAGTLNSFALLMSEYADDIIKFAS